MRPRQTSIPAGCIWRPAVTLLVAVLLCSAGCAVPALQEPTITLSGVEIENVTPRSTDLSLHLIIHNPNPIGATLTRVSFESTSSTAENGSSSRTESGEGLQSSPMPRRQSPSR
jgi:hypothetical protein